MIFLIGMPGVGKSFQAKKVAESLGCSSLDLDEYIEQQEGKTIPEIFSEKGEVYFREVERSLLMDIITENKTKTLIVACGGGTPLFMDNLDKMLSAGCVVWLDVDMRLLKERVTKDGKSRPLLIERDTEDILKELYSERLPYYEKAHFKLRNEDIELANFEKIVTQCIKQH